MGSVVSRIGVLVKNVKDYYDFYFLFWVFVVVKVVSLGLKVNIYLFLLIGCFKSLKGVGWC